MTLMSSREAKARGCPVCGSPDLACGGHPDQEVTPVDTVGPGPASPATVTARAVINGTETFFRTTPEEAEKNGWKIVSGTAEAQHTARSAPNTARSLEDHSVDELRTMAASLDIERRSKLRTKKALIREIRKVDTAGS